MALIIKGESCCALCSATIQKKDLAIATSHFIADPADPLFRYSDAAFHKRCFIEWPQKSEFIRRFNNVAKNFVFGNGRRHFMQNDGTIVSVIPEK